MSDTSNSVLSRIADKAMQARELGFGFNRQFFRELRDDIDLLEYLTTVSRNATKIQKPKISEIPPTCSIEGCPCDWRTEDACLLSIGGEWFCRNHHPKLKDGAVKPVGYSEPAKLMDVGEKANVRKA